MSTYVTAKVAATLIETKRNYSKIWASNPPPSVWPWTNLFTLNEEVVMATDSRDVSVNGDLYSSYHSQSGCKRALASYTLCITLTNMGIFYRAHYKWPSRSEIASIKWGLQEACISSGNLLSCTLSTQSQWLRWYVQIIRTASSSFSHKISDFQRENNMN